VASPFFAFASASVSEASIAGAAVDAVANAQASDA
jgi:hypothetical protein